MKYYKFRVDFLEDKISVYRDLETKYFVRYVRAFENVRLDGVDVNPHYHYYIEVETQSQNIRNFVKKNIGKGNGIYSLVELEENPIEYLAYISKQDKSVVWFNMNMDIKDECLEFDLKVKAQMKERKKNKRTQLEVIKDILIDKYGCIPSNKETLVDCVLEYYRESGRLYRKFHVISILQTLLLGTPQGYKDIRGDLLGLL